MEAFPGQRVLLVEDEAILAMSVEDMLTQLGCVVVGPALTIAHASALASSERLDAALLDINVGGGNSFAIAEVLKDRAVPFCFITGYGRDGVPEQFLDVPVLPKPYSGAALAGVLAELLN